MSEQLKKEKDELRNVMDAVYETLSSDFYNPLTEKETYERIKAAL